jgi:hypothetical protein
MSGYRLPEGRWFHAYEVGVGQEIIRGLESGRKSKLSTAKRRELERKATRYLWQRFIAGEVKMRPQLTRMGHSRGWAALRLADWKVI